MRCACGHVSLDLPDGLEDRTSYNLDEEVSSDPDRVELRFEALPDDVVPADVILDVRDRMASVKAAKWSFTEGEASVAGQPAPTLHAGLEIEGSRADVFVGAFRWGAAIATLTYRTVRRRDADALVAHVMGSVAGPEHEVPPAAGYLRRTLGRLSLDLPRGFTYPKTYLFETPDRAATLLVTSERGDAAEAPAFDPWLRIMPGEVLVTVLLSSRERATPDGGGLALAERTWRADLRTADGTVAGSGWFRQVIARWPDGLRVRVLLVETEGSAFGDRHWPALAASVQPTAPTA